MASPNEELVQRMLDAWNRRDLDAVLELAVADAVYVNPPMAVEPGERHGHEALATVMSKQWEGLGPDAHQRVERLHPSGDEVISGTVLTRTMPGSTAVIDNRVVIRWVFSDGRVARCEVLGAGSSYEEGLRAAGIDRQ